MTMRAIMCKLRNRSAQRGQGMTEYIIIVAVIAILSIAVVTKFGNQIRNLFFVSGSQMAGENESVDNKMDSADVDKDGLKDLGN